MSGITNLRKLAAVAALASGFAGVATAPAAAQIFGWMGYEPFEYHYREPESAPLPSGELSARLHRQGYRLMSHFRRNGEVILADVQDGRGRQMRLIIDMYDGRILQRFLNAEPRPQMAVPGPSRDPEDIDSPDDLEPAAPRARPPARLNRPRQALATPRVEEPETPAVRKPSRVSRPQQATVTPKVEDTEAPQVRKPAPKPQVAGRPVTEKPKAVYPAKTPDAVQAARTPDPVATEQQKPARPPTVVRRSRVTDPATGERPPAQAPTAAPRKPEVAAAPAAKPAASETPAVTPAPSRPAPAAPAPANQPGYVNGVPNTPLD